MNAKIALWLVLRALRWLAWITLLAWSAYFYSNRAPHLNSFGHLLPHAEIMLFGVGTAAVFLGFLEMMFRERAGVVRPSFGQLIPPKAAG